MGMKFKFNVTLAAFLAMGLAGMPLTIRANDADEAIAREQHYAAAETLEQIRQDLLDRALDAREAKRLADSVDAEMRAGRFNEAELARLRGDIVKIGLLLRTMRNKVDTLDDLFRKHDEILSRDPAAGQSVRGALEESETLASYRERIATLTAENRALRAATSPSAAEIAPVPPVNAPVRSMSPPLPAQQLAAGFSALAAGDIPMAMQAFKAVLGEVPGSDSAILGLASCHFELNELDTARRLVDDVLSRDADHPQALGLSGALLFRAGDAKGARTVLRRAVKLDDENAYNHNYLSVVNHGLGRSRDAIKHARRAVEIDPVYVSALYNLSVLLATERRPNLEEASAFYQRAIATGAPRSAALEAILAPAQP